MAVILICGASGMDRVKDMIKGLEEEASKSFGGKDVQAMKADLMRSVCASGRCRQSRCASRIQPSAAPP